MQQSYIAAKCTTCNHKFLCENKNEATKLIHICTHALFLGDSLSFIASSSDTSRFVVCTIIFDIFSQLSTKTFAARKFVTTNIFVRVRIISSSFGFTFCCLLFLSLSPFNPATLFLQGVESNRMHWDCINPTRMTGKSPYCLNVSLLLRQLARIAHSVWVCVTKSWL